MLIRDRLQAILLSPLVLLLAGTIFVPAAVLLGYSFFTFLYLAPTGAPTLDNFVRVLGDPLYRTVALNTVVIAVPVTLLSIIGGYALAYYATIGTSRWGQLVSVLVVSALMASYLVRVYAWRTLLGETGIVNSGLIAAGITDRPIEFLLFSRVSVIIAEVSLLMPFAALAFFSALSGIGPEFREAASDLGAGPAQTLRRITVPMTGAAVLATTAIVFFASAGDYITPVLVGGPDSATFGTLIASNFGLEGQYGLGAAASFLMILAFAIVYLGLRSSLRITKLLPESTQ